MYEYTWYQWLTFFFIYCFFGWIFESTYVSLKSKRFVNRGFLRLPMLPLYGSGAVMMLWVSLPVKGSLFLVFIFGVAAATILEYATGWCMEKLFRLKYWDYSRQRFNVKGYICLSSSIAWGFLTILLTEVIHLPIEGYVLRLPYMVNMVCVIVVSLVFAADAAESVKAALDLAKVLDAMTKMRAELDDIQVQMAMLKTGASHKMETAAERFEDMMENTMERMGGFVEGTAGKVGDFVEDTAGKMGGLMESTAGKMGELKMAVRGHMEKTAALSGRLRTLTEKHQSLSNRMGFYRRSLLKGNPTASSSRFSQALKELRDIAERKK